ncbi:uncharacterized protein RHIMIDRAFT_238626 [Rhizopus microsporus ATCC 52813]|uniref:Histone deacetylase interacting domain-containing protein n=1 Tax=Rhizopus microsporus ATCC 52813 TaxID=1340429 RepID=A0A2G4SQZ2_RHIZD|nr:uncharacterized protein RHIMIDRAFT_238626 [Rhizopus microsporus ATCC 52813]PHZ11183.1 hypothetical protein RHIMIDRAFT_238626 [Rhizopus microsporus ATCC 52813]
MSSPIQPPPNIRSPSGTSQTTAAATSVGATATAAVVSPYAHHLPPPNLPPANTATANGALPPPPRVTELPSILSPPHGASPSAFSNSAQQQSQVQQPHTTLPPPSSLASESTVLPLPPPLIPSRTSTPPFTERRPSIARTPANPPPPPPSQPAAPPATQQQQQQASSPQSGGYRPLNVRDALTYLDQVKVRFSDQPDVYNRFLDIMKDFKSQTIDTPGVIERVSALFKGHPTLISGFNTFLPPGYRIECSTDPREPDLITVTTPSGVTTTTGRRLPDQEHHFPHAHHPHVPPPQAYYPYSQMHHPLPVPPPNTAVPPQNLMPPYRSAVMPPPPTVPPIPHHHQQQQSLPPQQQQTMPSQPMMVPPRHASPSRQSVVDDDESPLEFNHAINYVNRIKTRFAHDPDTYKQFLEILQTYQKDNRPIQEVYAHVQYLFNGAPDLLDEFKQFLPDFTGQSAGSLFDSISHSGSKRSVGTGGSVSQSMLPPGKKKRTNNMIKRPKYKSDVDPFSFSNFDPARPSVSTEEIELFERIRKHIGNKPSYEEFLKTLNLYTQQIVDMDTLVDQVSIFIGNNQELFEWFKNMIGYEPREKPIEKPTTIIPKPDLNLCKTTGNPHESPSYRIVPKEWQNQPCSGRDQLCWEVLNDEYVSHPIWASEEDGFVASKKSQYEEAMHRCEEERYDYNMNIDANLNVIALLEPIAHKIEQMTPEEKNNFKLKPGLGGQSVSIYERIIKKIYDKERGSEIIELLYSNPAQVVPILLKRLKQKDEEWKRAQREWNKIWREQDAKNFYRSLDYQGITFKSNDRKAMAPKSLVNEIESLFQKNSSKKKNNSDCQFKFEFKDQGVFKDCTRIIYSFIDRQSGYTNSDREKIRLFIESFIPLCFQVDSSIIYEHTVDDNQDEDEDGDNDDDQASVNTTDSVDKSRKSSTPTKKAEDDHTIESLREILTQAVASRSTNLLDAAAVAIAPDQTKRSFYTFFCNTAFYCFFRLYQMLYERLDRLKAMDDTMRKNPSMGKRVNKVALDLGLYSTRYDDIDLSKGYYQAILELIDKFFDGDIDQTLFEEYTRYVFVTDAYLLFTIDKLVHTMIKQIQTIITDSKSLELIRLFKWDKGLESMSPRSLAIYRLRAEDIAGSSDNLFKINFNNESQYITIQLIGKDDYMMEPTAEDKYEDYVASYMDWLNVTDGIDLSKTKKSFLRRNLRPQDEHLNRIFVRSKLQYKIDQSSYHMYYIVGSEDVFIRPQPKKERERASNWEKWLSSPTTGWSKGLDEETRTLMEREAKVLFKQ